MNPFNMPLLNLALLNLALLLASLTGFICLALAMSRHSKQILRKNLLDSTRRALKVTGWGLLALALGLGIAQWQFDLGTVTWLGWLSIAGMALVFYLPWWPGQQAPAKPLREKALLEKPSREKPFREKAGRENTGSPRTIPAATATSPRARRLRAGLATAALLIPLAGFTWQLWLAPNKPLPQEDVVQGQAGTTTQS